MTLASLVASLAALVGLHMPKEPAIVAEPTRTPFLLFLRPSDTANVADLDSRVATAARDVEQVVGLGGPASTSRIVTAGDFRRLSAQALAIVIAPGQRPGVEWELASLARDGLLPKCLVLAPTDGAAPVRVSAVSPAPPPTVEQLQSRLIAAVTRSTAPPPHGAQRRRPR